MKFRIVNVFISDCHLVAQVEHYNFDDTVWHVEHYTFQGREGLKHKRVTNVSGEILMDNDEVAPMRRNVIIGDSQVPYLPEGRDWKRHSVPHMDDESILEAIRDTHKQRLVSGWPQNHVDSLAGREQAAQEDIDGCGILLTTFQGLIGYSE